MRAELIGLPDHTPLVVDAVVDATGNIYRRCPVIGAGYGPSIDPDEPLFDGQESPLDAGSC